MFCCSTLYMVNLLYGVTKFVQGYLIGNPATDADYDMNSFVPFAHGMGLISTDMYEVSGLADLMLIIFSTLAYSYSTIYPCKYK